MTDGLVVDLFAGGGGASTGIEAALEQPVDIAINHDEIALSVHRANHPQTRHFPKNVWKANPVKVTGGRPVGVMWASPDCTHHSVAKGGKPLKKNIRALAWVVVRWAQDVRPAVIFLENVAEFRGWGPLDRAGRPIKARKGETFRRWVRQLERLGYVVDFRILDASLYGAPTRRRRLFLVARSDGQAIRWPEPTHGPVCSCREISNEPEPDRGHGQAGPCRGDVAEVGEAQRRPEHRPGVRTGGERSGEACRDPERSRVPPDVHHHEWSGRHADGAPDRVDSVQWPTDSRPADQPQGRRQDQQPAGQPGARLSGHEQRARQSDGPVEAESRLGERRGEVVARPDRGDPSGQTGRRELPFDRGSVRRDGVVCQACGRPYSTRLRPVLTAAHCIDWSLPCPSIFERKRPLAEKTMWRIAQGLRRFVFESPRPFIVQYHNERAGDPARVSPLHEPLGTQTTENRFGLVMPSVVEMNHSNAPHAVDEPLGVVTTQHNRFNVVAPHLVKVNHGKQEARGEAIDEPVSTVTATQRGHALVTPVLVGAGGPARSGNPRPVDEPIDTVMPQNSRAVVSPVMVRTDMHKSNATCAYDAEDPLRTITTGGGHAVMAPTLIQTGYGERDGQAARVPGLEKPIGTLVDGQKHALVGAWLAKHFGGVVGQEVTEPTSTITAKDHHGLSAATLVKFRGNAENGHPGCAPLDEPMPTISAGGGKGGVHVAEVRAFLTAYYGEDGTSGQSVLEPLRTITAKHRLGLVTIEGTEYQIVDIGLRMLEPHELARAQFGRFAERYDLSAARTKSKKVQLIGNSVCPEVAEALVRANVRRPAERVA